MLWPARKTEASDLRMLTLNVQIKGNMNSNLIRCAV